MGSSRVQPLPCCCEQCHDGCGVSADTRTPGDARALFSALHRLTTHAQNPLLIPSPASWVWDKQRWKVFKEAVAILKDDEAVVEFMGGQPISFSLPTDEQLDDQGMRMEVRWSEEGIARAMPSAQRR